MFAEKLLWGLPLVLLLSIGGCGEPRIKISGTVRHDQAKAPESGKAPLPFIPLSYMIGPGDELEVLYGIDPGINVEEYLIDTEDTLRIEFFYYPTMNTTVKVRPDGRITAPLIGEMVAAGKKPSVLAEELQQKYRGHLLKPTITIDLLNFNNKVEELKKAITTLDRGQSRLVIVRPDGCISLPFVGDAMAAGRTAKTVSDTLQAHYRKYIKNLSVTVAVLRARSNRIYVMGAVETGNFYELLGVTTLSQAIAMAGGFADGANTHQVVVVSRDTDGTPKARVVDMDDIIGKGNIGADVVLNQYDVVFVPKTKLAQAALIGEYIWTIIPAQFTAGYTGTHSLGGALAQ